MTLLVRDATVITMDAARAIYAPGAVLIEGSQIVAVGPSEAVARAAPPDCEVMDASGRIALPGFVSAHNHLGYTVFRGRAEDVGHSPTHRLYLPMSLVMRRDEREALGSLAVAELLRGGVTTVFEMEEQADCLAPFIERSGIRAAIGIMTHDVDLERLMQGDTVFDASVRKGQIDAAVGFAEDWDGAAGGRITTMITANGLSTSSPSSSARCAALRIAWDCGFRSTWRAARCTWCRGFTAWTRSSMPGPTVFSARTCSQCIATKQTRRGIDAMAETGTHLAHCPVMNQFRGGIAPVVSMRARGVNVGLGIDNYFPTSST